MNDDPGDQSAHCMRRVEDDWEEGDAAAIRACRDLILSEIAAALGDHDLLDIDHPAVVDLFLAFNGATDVEMSRFAFRCGTTTLLTDMVGADRGTTGLYLGASVLGVTVPLTSRARLVVDPAAIAMPVPVISGMPFFYRQYRCSFGLEITL